MTLHVAGDASDVDFQAWALDLCELLDGIERAVADGDIELVSKLVAARFQLANRHGLETDILGPASGSTH